MKVEFIIKICVTPEISGQGFCYSLSSPSGIATEGFNLFVYSLFTFGVPTASVV
jgi:hypothetical protein